MADDVTRSAARLATLAAVPLALVAGVMAFALLPGLLSGDTSEPPTDPTGPATAAATTPVNLGERDLTDQERTACRALTSQLPQAVRELPQRPVTAGAEQNAAYGEPPITVECGVAPADYQPTDMVNPFDGVCWHGVEQDGASVWTTLDRDVPVRVTVPQAYEGPFQWAAEFSPSVVSTLLSADSEQIPAGCRG